MSDKLINILYGYSMAKAEQLNDGSKDWKITSYNKSNCRIIYELGSAKSPERKNNIRVLKIQNGVSTVTDGYGYHTSEEDGSFKDLKEEIRDTERSTILALGDVSTKNIGVSERFNGKSSDSSGVLTASQCVAIMHEEITKARAGKRVVDKLSGKDLMALAAMKQNNVMCKTL
jgi:hypothetical protein